MRQIRKQFSRLSSNHISGLLGWIVLDLEGGLGASVAAIGRCFSGVVRWFIATSSLIATMLPSRVIFKKC